MQAAHVERVIALFARKEKRERLQALAAKPARWTDFVDAFLHDTRSLDPATMTRVVQDAHASVLAELRARPSARAYCISAIAEIDGRELPLADALRAAVGRERDVLVFCIETERAYYENHEGERFVLAARR